MINCKNLIMNVHVTCISVDVRTRASKLAAHMQLINISDVWEDARAAMASARGVTASRDTYGYVTSRFTWHLMKFTAVSFRFIRVAACN